jgi:hypothetical protein
VFKAPTPPTVTPERPTLRSLYPAWSALSDRLKSFAERDDAILAEMKGITAQQDRRAAVIMTEPSIDIEIVPKPKPALNDRIRRLLGESAPAPDPEPPAKPAGARTVTQTRWGDERLAVLGRELADIHTATAILHPLLVEARATGSRLVCAEYAPDYSAVATQVCDALIALGSAIRSHNDLTASLTAQGADWVYLKPMDVGSIVAAVGNPQELGYSHLRRWLSSAAEGGHFEMQTIAAAWAPVAGRASPVVASVVRPARGTPRA